MESQGYGIGTPKEASTGNGARVSCFIDTVTSLVCELRCLTCECGEAHILGGERMSVDRCVLSRDRIHLWCSEVSYSMSARARPSRLAQPPTISWSWMATPLTGLQACSHLPPPPEPAPTAGPAAPQVCPRLTLPNPDTSEHGRGMLCHAAPVHALQGILCSWRLVGAL